MTSAQGQFVWYELMTTDITAAATFYSGVIGYSAADAGMPGMTYTILSIEGRPVSGLMPVAAAAPGAKPGWMGYVGVDDVDATAAEATGLGGVVCREPTDIPGVGRFAVLADPQGAPFIVFNSSSIAPERPAPNTPGFAGWHELQASDWQSAFDFYAGLFGWSKADAVDMGPMGLYQLFSAGHEPIGGMMTRIDPKAPPSWRYYFNTDDVDAAAQRIADFGGEVVSGPHQVPGGRWILHGLDPQRVSFALLGARSSAA